jgi:hypothetical protein
MKSSGTGHKFPLGISDGVELSMEIGRYVYS